MRTAKNKHPYPQDLPDQNSAQLKVPHHLFEEHTPPPQTYLMKIREVIAVTALKKSSIYSKMKTGEFPMSVKLSRTSVAWVSSEIFEWINSRPRTQEVM